MRRLAAVAVVALVALSAGCGGSDVTTDPNANNGAPCTVTITGAAAIAGTYTCVSSPFVLYAPTTNYTAFTMSISGTKTITGTLIFTGTPSTNPTYTNQGSSSLP